MVVSRLLAKLQCIWIIKMNTTHYFVNIVAILFHRGLLKEISFHFTCLCDKKQYFCSAALCLCYLCSWAALHLTEITVIDHPPCRLNHLCHGHLRSWVDEIEWAMLSSWPVFFSVTIWDCNPRCRDTSGRNPSPKALGCHPCHLSSRVTPRYCDLLVGSQCFFGDSKSHTFSRLISPMKYLEGNLNHSNTWAFFEWGPALFFKDSWLGFPPVSSHFTWSLICVSLHCFHSAVHCEILREESS